MSRVPYTHRTLGAARRIAFASALPFLLAGCSISLLGGDDLPKTTGSLAPAVELERPLPQTLAFSDAAKIGEAARVALLQANGATEDWENAQTGSSGTIKAATLDPPPTASGNCRPFSTTVTSIGGVHEYAGAICESESGAARMLIDERGATDTSLRPAGA